MRKLLLLTAIVCLGCSRAPEPSPVARASPEPSSGRYGLRPPKKMGDTRPLSYYEIPASGSPSPAPQPATVAYLPKPAAVQSPLQAATPESPESEVAPEETAAPGPLPITPGVYQARAVARIANRELSELERRQRILEGYEKRFILCDSNQDGRLSEEERLKGFQYLLEHRPVFRGRVDRNRDGTISKHEREFAQARFMKHPPRFKD